MTTMLERRRIEAEFAKQVFDVLSDDLGAEKARDLLGEVTRKAAFEAGQRLAGMKSARGGLLGFAELIEGVWQEGGALDIRWSERSGKCLSFEVVRCRYAEMYEELGVADLGDVLSCNRDGSLCSGYDPRIRMTRTETIMGGKPRCDFRFDLND